MSDKQTDAPQKQVHWANDYGDIVAGWHETRVKADNHTVQYKGRKSVIRREWVEGQPPQYFTEDV